MEEFNKEIYVIALMEAKSVIRWYMEHSTIPVHLVSDECNLTANCLDIIDNLIPHENPQMDLGELPF